MKLLLKVLLTGSIVVPLLGQLMRWYYTGEHLHSTLDFSLSFKGQNSPSLLFENLDQLQWSTSSALQLFNGGNFLCFTSVNDTVGASLLSVIYSELFGNPSETSATVSLKSFSARYFGLLTAVNYAAEDRNEAIVSSEIGLYDHSKRVFVKRIWKNITGGEIIAVKVLETRTALIEGSSSQQPLPPIEHKLLYSADLHGRNTLFQHICNQSSDDAEHYASNEDNAEGHKNHPSLRILTFNIWHNNPANWVYPDLQERWRRYSKRLSHWADVVVAEDPDVITLQEVRLDTAFASPDSKISHWVYDSNGNLGRKVDGGSQVEHVLSHLAAAWTRKGGAALARSRSYQVVYHPAMSMIDMARPGQRVEEGVLVLSRLPVLHSDVLLLPRDLGDPGDDHQRVLLRVQVDAGRKGKLAGGKVEIVPVDVMTTHLSLSDAARQRSVQTIVDLLCCNNSAGRRESPVQVLTGDFNAEPHEEALRFLSRKESFAGGCNHDLTQSGTTTTGGSRTQTPFVDTWKFNAVNKLLEGKNSARFADVVVDSEDESIQAQAEQVGLTFPACNPVKRIDFIFARNHTVTSSSSSSSSSSPDRNWSLKILDSRVIGKKPSPDTEYLVGSREGLGMLDEDSPLWASDHFGLVSDLLLLPPS